MDIRKLQRAIIDGLEDVKAQNIVVFNTEHLSPLFERVIIATANSNRQTKALANSVRDAVKTAGAPVPRSEGEENGEWIIVDCGDAVVHIMQPTIRAYYRLEEIWGDKPVRVKLISDKPKGSDEGETPALSASKKKSTAPQKELKRVNSAKKVPAKKTPERKTVAKSASAQAAAPGKKTVGNAPSSKSAGTARATGKKTAVKKTATKKTSTRKTAAKSAAK